MGQIAITLVAGVLVLGLVAGLGSVAVEIIMHHTKLNSEGTVTLDGTNPADPIQLASDAGLDLPRYALSRMVESEAGGLPDAAKLGVAFAALTHAGTVNRGIAELLLRSSGAGNGFFGRQDQGRYATTAKDPSPAAIDAATRAIEAAADDPTDGADQWDSPWSYKDSDYETAEEKAERVAAARRDAGKELVVIPGVPQRKLRFWRSA
jgi:hypothetical protein